ncbi:MAG: hypothetical protein ACPGLV_02950 [Bacteroidia bacterium]
MEEFFSDIVLRLGYVLLVLGVLVAVGFAVMTVVSDMKGAIKSIVGFVLLMVIFLICYGVAGDEVLPKWTNYGVDAGISKLIGAFINTAFVLFIIGAVVGVLGSVYTMIKK